MKMSLRKHGNPRRPAQLPSMVTFRHVPSFPVQLLGSMGKSWHSAAIASGVGSTAIFKSIHRIYFEYLDRIRREQSATCPPETLKPATSKYDKSGYDPIFG